ncbi:MAG: stage II sporulation protein M [Candidatus Bathyarchaeota archaeon]|nr:MAG: stage II sporulation protein M [Candidatus Bathyarchaeota archaeon]
MTFRERRSRPRGFLGYLFGSQAEYVKGLAPLFILCAIIFISSMVFGYSSGTTLGLEALEEKLEFLPDMEGQSFVVVLLTFFVYIFFNNAVIGFMFMLLGLVFGVPPLLFLALNGYMIGGVVSNLISEMGVAYTVAGLLPHGVLEISTIILSSASGMSLGYSVMWRLRGRSGIRSELGRAVRLYMTRIVPFLLLAASIEVTITPLLGLIFGLS